MNKYHQGELEVQRLAGVEEQAARLSGSFYSSLPEAAQQFLAERQFAAITWHDRAKRLWITPLSGEQGFLRATDRHSIVCDLSRISVPLLTEHKFENDPVALVVMDFSGRRRMRINGTARSQDNLVITVEQTYGNCPKYIQKREPERFLGDDRRNGLLDALVEETTVLDAAMQRLIGKADTFFIGTYAEGGGADASHRGGAPGFVRADDHTVSWTDYPGNNMFNTLGNIQANSQTALLFLDFESGEGLALSGSTETFSPSISGQAAPKKTVFRVQSAKFLPRALAHTWILTGYSPFNQSV